MEAKGQRYDELRQQHTPGTAAAMADAEFGQG